MEPYGMDALPLLLLNLEAMDAIWYGLLYITVI
jgi:hypothetical protein